MIQLFCYFKIISRFTGLAQSKSVKQEVSSTVILTLQTMCPDLAKFRHYGKILTVFGKILIVYFLFGKIVEHNLVIL